LASLVFILLKSGVDMTEKLSDLKSNAVEAIAQAMSKAVAVTLCVAGAYFVGATISGASGTPVSPWWPASGVALAALVVWGVPAVPGIYAGLAMGNLVHGLPEKFVWQAPLGLLGESCAALLLLRWALGKRPQFDQWKSVLGLVLVAPWLPALANGILAERFVDTSTQVKLLRSSSDLALFVLANGFGIALVAPALLVWKYAPDARWWRRMAVLVPAATAVGWGVFAFSLPADLLLLPLLVAAAAVDLRGTAPLVLLTSLALFIFSGHGAGPFVLTNGGINFTGIYVFIAVLAFGVLPLAAFCGEQSRRLRRDEAGGRAAGLRFWSWTDDGGAKLADSNDEAVPPGELFEMQRDRGSLETRSGGRDAMSFWMVTGRRRHGQPREVSGVLLDVSERLQMEQTRRQIWQSEIELRNLRASLTPHLLFNCLAAVRGVVRSDPEKARAFIDQLARFLRESNNAQARPTIPLLDEWQLCEDFLALQALRYERELPRLVDIEGPAHQVSLPPMMILNLVENAVKHGDISQNHPLVVRARMRGSELEIVVRNHGQFAKATPQRPSGLTVARARLQVVYGNTASLLIRQEGTEVVAVMKIPWESAARSRR